MNWAGLIEPTLGLALSAPVAFWLLAGVWHAFGQWPIRDAPTQPGGHMRGGCAKHDWAGYSL